MMGLALWILSARVQAIKDAPMPDPYTCICTYTVGCGGMHSKPIPCDC